MEYPTVLLPSNPIILSIEGNIGAGKSTFLSKLRKEYPSWHFIDEPVDTWTQFRNENNESLLEVYYKDKGRWSFTFQSFVFITRIRNLINFISEVTSTNESNERLIFVTERCVDSDFNIFVTMLHNDGFINQMEFDIYKQWYGYMTVSHQVNGIIYITCPPEKCLERITQRNRQGENVIPLDYLERLRDTHETWINSTTTPVLRVDTTSETSVNSTQIDSFLTSF